MEFEDEYDEMTDEEENDDYDENGHFNLKNRFTLEEMKNIIEWVDQHPNTRFATIFNRFKKIKSMNYITRFREYIEHSGTGYEKLKQIKEFMFDQFYLKRALEKEAVHDADFELYSIQKVRELNWDEFKASKSFINTFNRENRISSTRVNKIITRTKSE